VQSIRLLSLAEGVAEDFICGGLGCVGAVEVLRDGRLALGNSEGKIKLWDWASGSLVGNINGHSGKVNTLALLQNGHLASGSETWDPRIRLWDSSTGNCIAILEGHSLAVNTLLTLSDGRLASGSTDCTIKLWNLASGACQRTMEGHGGRVLTMVELPDNRLISGSDDRSIRQWDTAIDNPGSGGLIFMADAAITALAFITKSSLLVAGDASGKLHWLKMPPR